jgi:hypothetical protein
MTSRTALRRTYFSVIPWIVWLTGWERIVKFAVNNDSCLLVLAGDWLITSCEVNDAEPRVAKRDPAIRRNPVALSVGAAMVEALRRFLHHIG